MKVLPLFVLAAAIVGLTSACSEIPKREPTNIGNSNPPPPPIIVPMGR